MRYCHTLILGISIGLAACQSRPTNEEGEKPAPLAEAVSVIKFAEIESKTNSFMAENAHEDGYFHLEQKGKDLRLKLLRLHTDFLYQLSPQRSFVCVDLVEAGGDVYDVDFFLQEGPRGLTVTETAIHSVNGKPFYTRQQDEEKNWHKVAIEDSSPELLGVKNGKDEFEFHYKVRLPEITGTARLWVPVPKSDRFQTVKILSLQTPSQHQLLQEKENGNTILYLELSPDHSGKLVDLVYQVERQEKVPYEDPELMDGRFLGSSQLMPVGGQFSEIASKVIEGKQLEGKVAQARALYEYVMKNMQYIKTGNYGNGDAVYACDTRTGNCSEFHSFFISLARSVGIPARFAIGVAIPSERNEGAIGGYHCWAEFYAEGKWWPVDISEGNKYETLADYYFGHHPANRIELSQGRDLQPEPGPLSGPINFLAYPLLEIEGEPVQTKTSFSFTRKRE